MSELVTQLSEQTTRLVRDEMRLAQAELKEKGKHAGVGAGLFGGAGLVAFFGGATLITTIILALALLVPVWLSALIVTVVLFIIAGIAALVGKKQIKQAVPPAPETTMENVKRDVNEVKEHGHR
ncbi:phage holin family protein [Arthrobacter sp. H14]|uniref:phage holin family protein n=1 Tax=Arthrobacter sp. H14 TaxID=1312959 RepID=UPI0020A64F94|nr:phage holin family protein [Arthrobacter sp. H14]